MILLSGQVVGIAGQSMSLRRPPMGIDVTETAFGSSVVQLRCTAMGIASG